MIDRRHQALLCTAVHSCTNHKRSSADDICTLSSPPLVSTQTRSQAYSSVPGVLSVACLGQRVQLELISFVFTVLEGETSVVEIPRKRGICGWFSSGLGSEELLCTGRCSVRKRLVLANRRWRSDSAHQKRTCQQHVLYFYIELWVGS